jgi:hypothetical protein
MSDNPWVAASAAAPTAAAADDEALDALPVLTGPARPLGGISLPEDALPVRARAVVLPPGRRWWWVGCHGGAGVSTLARVLGDGVDAARGWPSPGPGVRAPAVLVARTHASGLLRAQSAARQWACGALPAGTDLLGLVLVPDAPGALPRPLEHLLLVVCGGVPRCWRLPWDDRLRLGDLDGLPRSGPLRRLSQDLSRLADEER